MPALLCLSPLILDQSFPRDEEELGLVALALGEIEEYFAADRAHLLLTEVLSELIQEFDWTSEHQSLLVDIHRYLQQWFRQPRDGLVAVDVADVTEYQPHAVPQRCAKDGLVDFWADELGRILSLHDECCDGGRFFIGIACPYAFAGEEKDTYAEVASDVRAFPLVGDDDLPTLDDAYAWVIPNEIHQKSVSFADIEKHYHVIGALAFEPPSGGGSHYKLRFEYESWPVSKNTAPETLTRTYLKQLITITGYPLDVLKTALISGRLPEKALKLPQVSPPTTCL
jgi:hypothetical protein